jgi:type I restriction enzyme R subunit
MPTTYLNESDVEEAALGWLDSLGYTPIFGPSIAPEEPAAERSNYQEAFLERRLRDALVNLNPNIPADALEQAFRKITRPESPSLIANNRAFHKMLVDGVEVEYQRFDGSIAGDRAKLIDFDDIDANDWLVVNQFTVLEEQHNRRPDAVIFVNGLPLAVLELKNATDENATIWTAFNQIQTYKQQIPSLFVFNEALIVSDGLKARIGILSSDRERFMPWCNAPRFSPLLLSR